MNLKEAIQLINIKGVTAYEIHKETGLNEAGVRRLLNGEIEKPQKKTQDVILSFANTIQGNTKTDINIDDRLEDKNKIIELLEQQVKSNNEIKELLQELKEMKRGVMINGVMISEVKEYLKEYFKTKTK